MAGLYLHIPFCKQACYYCDFHFSTDSSVRHKLLEAMGQELTLQTEYLQETFSTIYLGGGTPSLLATQEIDFLFDRIRHQLKTAPGEVTLEANPDDLTKEKAKELKGLGINRLSIGIQSFDDSLLRFLNRAHQAEAARQCMSFVRDAGFDNVSVDLIYAIPGLDQALWRETLQEAIRYSPEHISAYALTIEEKTVFGNWQKRGKLHPMAEEDAAIQFEILMDVLGEAGYEQYEISNFSKPGFHACHNSGYWNQTHYLGIGPSAHSYNGTCRQYNVRNNALYVRSIHEGKVPFELEVLTPENKINEYILTSLRTELGCNLFLLKTELNDNLLSRSGDYLAQLQQEGLAMIMADTLRLTRKGKLLADKISEDLMISA
jgi:oxygen-independent coproporphyrinogen-3 oxidase